MIKEKREKSRECREMRRSRKEKIVKKKERRGKTNYVEIEVIKMGAETKRKEDKRV